jgi:hypothetical protein
VNSLPRVVAPSVILRGVVATRGNSQCRWWGRVRQNSMQVCTTICILW